MIALTLSLLALAPAPAQDTDPAELLPAAPAGWRFERLEFPLGFAPGIELRGFEELRFGPGMLTPGSDTYFSYALALRLEGELDVDADFLRLFLAEYYRGLCGAVGKDRGLELDLAAVTAEVERRGAGFRASVDMFDPFTTGDPLALRLELFEHQGVGATEVLGLASPLAEDAAVWEQLRAMGDAWRAARPDAVLFNHLYVVADQVTYDALAGSEFLRGDFAVFEERSTSRADTSYHGLYFYGRRTYFEFLRPDAAGGFAAGGTGLAFGLEREGGTRRLKQRLAAGGVNAFEGAITRELDGDQLPWFEIMGVEKPTMTSKLSLFTLEYDPRFLTLWHPDRAPAGGGVTRGAILTRYAASLGRLESRGDTLAADVTEVLLELDAAERKQLADVCAVFGYAIEPGGESGWTARGPGFRLVVRPSEAPGGVTAFTLRLRRPVEPRVERFGRATLTLAGGTATFSIPRD